MGIWLIYYGISSTHRDEYLHWFEGQHIDEKLARPGYDWACHYEVVSGGIAGHADHSFVAMFGGKSTRPFFDPSPAQIKPHQDELTRTMIARRVQPTAAIVTEEWCEYRSIEKQLDSQTVRVVASPLIRLGIFAEAVDDQEVVAWCAQSLFPSLTNSNNLVEVHKLLASFGANRHMVLEGYSDDSIAPDPWQEQPDSNVLCNPVVGRLRVAR